MAVTLIGFNVTISYSNEQSWHNLNFVFCRSRSWCSA